MTKILAIDPGDIESGIALIDATTRQPIEVAKLANDDILTAIRMWDFDHLAIEMIASYGMPVGREVFETCVWIGRFLQHDDHHRGDYTTNRRLVYRRLVKLHHCHSAKAKDSNIIQALVDRFAPGQSNFGKGTKADPGWFYGFSKDRWQAYALAVMVADELDPAGGAPY